MEEICSIVDKVNPDVLRRSLPADISIDKLIDSQNLRYTATSTMTVLCIVHNTYMYMNSQVQ
jgi:hypothetical protein